MADLFNLSFMIGVFPSTIKTAKVVPIFKKDSKLDYSSYLPISLLSHIEKILEKPMHKRFYTFLNNNNIIYNLQFGFKQQYSTSHALINITENIRKALWWWKYTLWSLYGLTESFWYHRPTNTVMRMVFVVVLNMVFVELQMIGLNPIWLIAVSLYL